MPITYLPIGSDGIALSADGEHLFFGAVGSRYLYSVPTERLRDKSEVSEVLAQAAVVSRGQKGVSDGYETDSNNLIYFGNMEQNAVSYYNPANGTTGIFVRDPRVNWVDTCKFCLAPSMPRQARLQSSDSIQSSPLQCRGDEYPADQRA